MPAALNVILLVIASASGGCQAALMEDTRGLAAERLEMERGLAGAIPPMLERLLAGRPSPGAVAVLVGPGSFTGLRAGIAAGTGIGMALRVPVVGVSGVEALAAGAAPEPGRALWIAIDSRRDHVFLDSGAGLASCGLDALPAPAGKVAVAGDAAIEVAARLAARGVDTQLTDARTPSLAAIAAVARRRLAGEIPPLPPAPLYVDPPATT